MEEKKKNLKIKIPFDNFQNHLDLEDNYRIIFSGIFGIGKTTFIKDFFKSDLENKNEYEAIHLFPVNYSVANNEDIFELVKFDVLLQLLTKNVVFDKIDLGTDLTLTQFVKDNFIEVLSPFLNFIPAVGGSLSKITDKLIMLKKKYDEYKFKLENDELKSINAFLEEFTEIKGSIYEEDFYTNLIQGLINQLKEKEKELILIIDDLDRIDPEHIFRLLNVFAAQVDVNPTNEQENKFGFDKVIFVCDIENIRNIYKHKYGVETDFNGYIDKFYSRELFKFNAKEIIDDYLKQILETVTVNEGEHILSKFGQNKNPNFFRLLGYILHIMFSQSLINLRDLLRLFERKDLSIPSYNLERIGYPQINNTSLIITQLYDSLNLILGNNPKKLLEATQRCKISVEHSVSEITNIISNSLIILDVNNHKFKDLKKGDDYKIYTYDNLQYEIIEDRWGNRFKATLKENKANDSEINCFDYLYKAFVKIDETII